MSAPAVAPPGLLLTEGTLTATGLSTMAWAGAPVTTDGAGDAPVPGCMDATAGASRGEKEGLTASAWGGGSAAAGALPSMAGAALSAGATFTFVLMVDVPGGENTMRVLPTPTIAILSSPLAVSLPAAKVTTPLAGSCTPVTALVQSYLGPSARG